MNSKLLLETKINIPEVVLDKKKIGKNYITQLAQKEDVIDVDVYGYTSTCFLLKDKIGNEYYLKLPRSKGKVPVISNVLKAKTITDITNLNENTELQWENNLHSGNSRNPNQILESWINSFNFNEEDKKIGAIGLRKPQFGAIHAISATWSVNKKCGTVVMPTGTGKTETMMSVLLYHRCSKVLILVPSKALRKQTVEKFLSLGCLQKIGVIGKDLCYPRVAEIKHGIKEVKEIEDLVEESNILVSTSYALNNISSEVKAKLAESCTHLFIDEAHHVPAKTWDSIKKLFEGKYILQFTATPFRTDGKRIEGEIIYNYPLGMAQEDGYFRKINLKKIQENDDRKSDKEIAKNAINILAEDIKNGLDHILMVRAKDTKRADALLSIYNNLGASFNPVAIHSKLEVAKRDSALESISKRDSRIIICVDMLGEGFDLPNLKIAAMHDVHKSLAVTLQFIGRFVRDSKGVGDATVVVNIADQQVNKEIEALYSEDADWNMIIRQKSESKIKKEIDLHEFIDSFQGELSKQISLWNLRPSFSTLIYKTKCETWNPEKFIEILPSSYKYWYAISEKENILVVVIYTQEEVMWGRYKDIKNASFDLGVVHWSKQHNALFIQCSNYDIFNTENLARKICGDDTLIENGKTAFNIFSDIERPMIRNLGASAMGNIRYTMYFGPDVTNGLSDVDKASSTLNNIFGWGFEKGEKVLLGCSAKKGKIWSRGGGTIIEWREWCKHVASKVLDDHIDEAQLIKGFLRPQKIETRYVSVPLAIEWGEKIAMSSEEHIYIDFDGIEHELFDVTIEITDYSDSGPVFFKVSCNKAESFYKIEYNKNGCVYSLVRGNDLKIRKYSGQKVPLIEYFKNDPAVVMYADGSFSYNNFHVPTPKLNTYFDKSRLDNINWTGVDIKIESQGKEVKRNSVQYKMIESFKEDYDIIFNDDDSGEAADIIALRQNSEDAFKLHLIHCKYSSNHKPGARISDLYELCGQAQKCIRWKHNGMDYLVSHMKKREEKWKEGEASRFIKGDLGDLNKLRKFARSAKLEFEVTIVQPGVSKQNISDNMIQLLGCTDEYLLKTANAKFNVICSD